MKTIIKTLFVGMLGVTMAASLFACKTVSDMNPESYKITFVDEQGSSICEEYEVNKGQALTAPDISSYLSEKHFLGYKIEMEDLSWGDLLTALPESVEADTKFLVVLEPHSYTQSEYDANGHRTKCSCGKTTASQPHSLSEVTEESVAASCVSEGKTVEACDCGYSKETKIDALGHEKSEWKSDETHHYKDCLRSDCDATELDKAEHTFAWGENEDGTAYEKGCSVCGYVSQSLSKTAFTSANLKTDWALTEKEKDAVSLENNKVTVNLSTATGLSDTSLILNKTYEEFVLKYTLTYTSTGHTGERYANVKVGDYTLRYYPYNDQFQVLDKDGTLVASCYEGALSQHLTVVVEVKLIAGKLSVTVDEEELTKKDSDCIVSGITGYQEIGIYANRVGFEMSAISLCHGVGQDRVVEPATFTYDSQALKDSTVTVPEYTGNSVSLENDKIKFVLSNDTAHDSAAYDAQVVLNKKHKGDFEISFDLTYETGHTQTRFLAISIGGVTYKIDPSNEKVFAYRGEYNNPTSTTYETAQNASYMSGKFTIKLENGNLRFYHGETQLVIGDNSDFYFNNIDSASGLNITFTARRLNLEISNLTVTEI